MDRLKRRAEFKRAAKGVRVGREAFTLQAVRRQDDAPARVGFTVTKKTGNAVVRNRIKRRLRALAADHPAAFEGATDYVIIARRAALATPYEGLASELAAALSAAGKKLQRDADRQS
ncbi:ribonuclease P protein component [Acuticoccus sp. MNP-M23]|uniref:ribonuclease P protein component n=1 Tax=Acuticoccus sp. MNP-M23 TaxID=3072793 RepID=UPI0028160000|nr:ribonuclease P protein component [Acuticoccus sp. MNP-M23]WMS42726.1 ribonuclease P protein component [Acuticoccus sp. MNP-M23]